MRTRRALRSQGHSPHGECGLKSYCERGIARFDGSLPAWGVRVEIRLVISSIRSAPCHSPHGECGLKSYPSTTLRSLAGHSPHGECGLKLPCPDPFNGGHRHSPHGECGLKSTLRETMPEPSGHSPHGECGLKFSAFVSRPFRPGSLPAWGVRVEITHPPCDSWSICVTPRMGSAG